MTPQLLIVDDEPSLRKVLRALLSADGAMVDTATDGQEAIEALQRRDYHAVITDQKMPRVDGIELLNWVRANKPAIPVILITAYGTVDAAKEAIKLGAHDYLTKPFDRDELKSIVAKAVGERLARETRAGAGVGRFDIIGQVPSMQEVFRLIEKVADSPSTVMITGESGTGKELVARALHRQSGRRDGPFVTVNCGAIPKDLFEAELFGHEKGAFTGAHATRPGRFELADEGTLFLDEVGELPLDLQVKLLRVIQERSFERVGGARPIRVDVRLVAATNQDLRQAVREGRFRDDLFYRLHVVPIHLPPLRDRSQDIPLLVEHFIERFNKRLGRAVVGTSDEVLDAFQDYRWPGNIRELENLVERSVLLADGERITHVDLPTLDAPLLTLPHPDDLDELNLKDYVRKHTAKLERDRIARALDAEQGNVTRAARRLGISRKSLQTKMKEYDLRDR
ncbi:MAG: sigma-54-dependent Fis family transcriptional regulator [Alphaproteobacteria bacterium]|nr:sigma-54-dependent Fis family transcriptional regulator [Alphaproteobacteria bacterium]